MLLYHYCGWDKFKSIVHSKSLWLTQIVRSNDTEEINRTLRVIWERIRPDIENGIRGCEKAENALRMLDKQMQLEEYVSLEGDETPYGVCLSVNKDLAQNWNEYGDMSRGVAIGFSEELLSGIQHDMPHPSADFNNSIGWNQVYYDSEELSRQFIPLFVDVLRNSPLGWLTVRTTLKHYSAFIKNPTFKDEREVRIVYYPSKDHDQSLNLDFSGLEMEPIPHCTLPWLRTNDVCALKEIIVGTNCSYTEEDIRNLLVENGINNNISIKKSEYSYRISMNR